MAIAITYLRAANNDLAIQPLFTWDCYSAHVLEFTGLLRAIYNTIFMLVDKFRSYAERGLWCAGSDFKSDLAGRYFAKMTTEGSKPFSFHVVPHGGAHWAVDGSRHPTCVTLQTSLDWGCVHCSYNYSLQERQQIRWIHRWIID